MLVVRSDASLMHFTSETGMTVLCVSNRKRTLYKLFKSDEFESLSSIKGALKAKKNLALLMLLCNAELIGELRQEDEKSRKRELIIGKVMKCLHLTLFGASVSHLTCMYLT